ncbi:Uncharacterised protein [Klebsiella variicola]|nr:Uncharacterised protein [Klebsiella variicola]
MRPKISITLITPHVTIERYSELTGLSIDTINDMLADDSPHEAGTHPSANVCKSPHHKIPESRRQAGLCQRRI